LYRYIDDGFMTWNKSEQELRKLMDEANAWHPNIKLDYQIGPSLPFLDVFLTNENGILSTTVYHKPSAEPYVVPFISDHPRHVFGNIIQGALTRAVRYSSTYAAFDYERRSIKLLFLFNGFVSCLYRLNSFLLLLDIDPQVSTNIYRERISEVFLEGHHIIISIFILYHRRTTFFSHARPTNQGNNYMPVTCRHRWTHCWC
jgi:hypothetical protein